MRNLPTREFKVQGKLPEGNYRIVTCASCVLAVYDDGRVWNVRLARWAKPDIDSDGYACLSMAKVHRLVLLAFVGPGGKGHVARHLNGKTSDNRLVNLCWGTQAENWADKRTHGTSTVGEKHGRAKLTQQAIAAIRDSTESHVALAHKFGVTPGAISHVRHGRSWKCAR